MTVLVTGGAGFIGAEVVRLLVERGDEPVHVTSHSGNVQRLHGVTDQVTLHTLDLADPAQIDALVAEVRPRAVYHLGAMLSGPSEQDPQACIRTNAYCTHALLEAARVNEVEQFLFASSIGTFVGSDTPEGPRTDRTLQRPDVIYGVTKVFGEQLGRYYRKKYGLDFRGIRYPGIVGPGVTTWSLAQWTCWVIEKPALGEPFTVWTDPDTRITLVYFKEAGAAMVQLADAPLTAIETINYNLGGVQPTPSAGRLADAVRARVPGARIDFEPDPAIMAFFPTFHELDDSCARAEWGWSPRFDHEAMIEDFLAELRDHPERYG
ncbi:MAG: NAD-dependent epimerase/dehydratase family protein [Acidimicrobiales bacterium]|nr:NAD-dependent epimerase/dehydratase family protein [Acidimicrobiales bacterium]